MGQHQDPDQEKLGELLAHHKISQRFLQVMEKKQSCVVKKNLLFSDAQQLAWLFIELGVMVKLKIQLDAEAWKAGVKKRDKLPLSNPITPESIEAGTEQSSTDDKNMDSIAQSTIQYRFPTSTIRPAIFLPERTVKENREQSTDLVFHRPSIPVKITFLIALLLTIGLCLNLLPFIRTLLPLSLMANQLINIIVFIAATLLFSRGIYQRQVIEIVNERQRMVLEELSEVWQRDREFVLEIDDEIESISYEKSTSSLTYQDKNGELRFTYQQAESLNEGAANSLNEITSGLTSHWLFDATQNIKQLIDRVRGVENDRIRFRADIIDENNHKVALLTIGRYLTLKIRPSAECNRDKILAFALVLSNSAYE